MPLRIVSTAVLVVVVLIGCAMSHQYHIPLPFFMGNLDKVHTFLNQPKAAGGDPLPHESGVLYADDYIRIEIDPHIRGPLLGEIETEFRVANPWLRVRVFSIYDDCNRCRMPGIEECTLVDCPYYWSTFLYLGRRRTDEAPFPPLIIPPLNFDWSLSEMRERWQASTGEEPFPFGYEEPGDTPLLITPP